MMNSGNQQHTYIQHNVSIQFSVSVHPRHVSYLQRNVFKAQGATAMHSKHTPISKQ